jgi:RNA polymerase sigma-70 factor (ECF subfamily)
MARASKASHRAQGGTECDETRVSTIDLLMESPLTETDDAIVREVLGGRPAAFDQLVERYRGRAHRYASRALGNRADAEDAVQESFIRAFLGLGGYEPRGRFSGWFYQILINECRGAALRRKRHDHGDLDDLTDAETPPATIATESAPEVDGALMRLEPLLREAFLLRYVEDMSYDQMSQATGAGESALRMRVKRARDRLRELLSGVNS